MIKNGSGLCEILSFVTVRFLDRSKTKKCIVRMCLFGTNNVVINDVTGTRCRGSGVVVDHRNKKKFHSEISRYLLMDGFSQTRGYLLVYDHT